MNIFQNLHFTDNQTADKSDKAYEMHIVINHLNKVFQDAMSAAERQSIDECMITLECLIEGGWGGGGGSNNWEETVRKFFKT